MTIYEHAMFERECILREIAKTKKALNGAPKGVFRCHKDGNSFRWYQAIDGKKPIPISKKNLSFAKELASSTFQKNILTDLERKLKAVNTLLKEYDPSRSLAEKFLNRVPMIDGLISFDSLLSEAQKDWKQAPYEKYNGHPETLNIMTTTGTKVRSKSEMIILEELERNGIAYHYEEILFLQDGIYVPDFVILHPVTNRKIYWEHFGLMDRPGRADAVFGKLKVYFANNIFPGYNLVMTFESSEYPLSVETVQEVIRQNFR